jgi:hypothetical protein
MAVIDEIKFAQTTTRNRMADVPVEPIIIQSATLVK